jgi:hypothetical protein
MDTIIHNKTGFFLEIPFLTENRVITATAFKMLLKFNIKPRGAMVNLLRVESDSVSRLLKVLPA